MAEVSAHVLYVGVRNHREIRRHDFRNIVHKVKRTWRRNSTVARRSNSTALIPFGQGDPKRRARGGVCVLNQVYGVPLILQGIGTYLLLKVSHVLSTKTATVMSCHASPTTKKNVAQKTRGSSDHLRTASRALVGFKVRYKREWTRRRNPFESFFVAP